jgi:segregation and condensation protein A
MAYKVKLESFEGPLDLLLFLIKKNEVDIYNIPVAAITQQYLEYLEIIQLLDLESASDFIFMAATLMRIKAQMLLPKPSIEEEDEAVEDPRRELVFRLLEYKRFKDAALGLAQQEDQARQLYPRGTFAIERAGLEEEMLISSDVTLFDLIAAFKRLVEQSKKVTVHHVIVINVTLEERIEYIQKMLADRNEIEFSALFRIEDDKIVWIVTFIALLEMIKQHFIRAIQPKPFDEIIMQKIDG